MSQPKQQRNTRWALPQGRCIIFMLSVVFSLATPAWAQTCDTKIVPSTPDRDFSDAGGGMVLHKPTGLIWKRCAEGQTWNGTTCTGEPLLFTWRGAFKRVAAVNASESDSPAFPNWLTYLSLFVIPAKLPQPTEGAIQKLGVNDWRLPNINELLSIVERSCQSPAVNKGQFPRFPALGIWSSSPVADSSGKAWSLGMVAGLDKPTNQTKSAFPVYLVRGGNDFLNFDSGVIPSVLKGSTESNLESAPPPQFNAAQAFSPEAQSANSMPPVHSEYIHPEKGELPESSQSRSTELTGGDQASRRLALQAEPRLGHGGVMVAVPSLETWGLRLLSLLLCGMGMLATRRR